MPVRGLTLVPASQDVGPRANVLSGEQRLFYQFSAAQQLLPQVGVRPAQGMNSEAGALASEVSAVHYG